MGNAYRHSSYVPVQNLIEETVYNHYRYGNPKAKGQPESIHTWDLDSQEKSRLLAAYFKALKKNDQQDELIDVVVSSDDLIGTLINAASSDRIADQNQLLIEVGQILIDGLFKKIEKRVDDDLSDEFAKYPAKLDRIMSEDYED